MDHHAQELHHPAGEAEVIDVSHLRRDRSLAVDDLSFAGGVMKFLGVIVREGGVTASKLNAPTDA